MCSRKQNSQTERRARRKAGPSFERSICKLARFAISCPVQIQDLKVFSKSIMDFMALKTLTLRYAALPDTNSHIQFSPRDNSYYR